MPEKITFERASKVKRDIPDAFINRALDDRLSVTPEGRGVPVKLYMDMSPRDDSDTEFRDDKEKQAEFHAQVADLIARHVHLYGTEKHPESAKVFEAILSKYRRKLSEGNALVADYLTGKEKEFPYDEFIYVGLNAPLASRAVDFTQGISVKGVSSNVFIQSEASGTFVHLTSDAYIEAKEKGEKPQLTRRIYLNPRNEHLVAIFDEILTTAKDSNIPLKGKLWDRTAELVGFGSDKTIRSDAIVLYVDDAHADELLSVVEQIYGRYQSAFRDRSTPKLAMRVAPGVGIGDEPKGAPGRSLTSHRVDIIDETIDKTKLTIEKQPHADRVAVFRGMLHAAMLAEGVNPDNISFNK